ncbi:MAG: hypothetical protein D6730_21925 [Bacteroidetes bacterium]|nr:MAG: hypothetical protein D6730_21925 [Bacteroidota bacterium]
MKHARNWILLALTGYMALACQRTPYLAETTFENDCWNIEDTLSFDLDLPAAEADSQLLHIKVLFLEDYAFRNIYLKLMVHEPGGNTRDTLLHELMVDPQGYWTLPRRQGGYPLELRLPLNSFQPPGSYQFRLTQYMRPAKLCNIRSVAVWVE